MGSSTYPLCEIRQAGTSQNKHCTLWKVCNSCWGREAHTHTSHDPPQILTIKPNPIDKIPNQLEELNGTACNLPNTTLAGRQRSPKDWSASLSKLFITLVPDFTSQVTHSRRFQLLGKDSCFWYNTCFQNMKSSYAISKYEDSYCLIMQVAWIKTWFSHHITTMVHLGTTKLAAGHRQHATENHWYTNSSWLWHGALPRECLWYNSLWYLCFVSFHISLNPHFIPVPSSNSQIIFFQNNYIPA